MLRILLVEYHCSGNKLLSYCNMNMPINSLPNDKILDWSELKTYADDK